MVGNPVYWTLVQYRCVFWSSNLGYLEYKESPSLARCNVIIGAPCLSRVAVGVKRNNKREKLLERKSLSSIQYHSLR